MSDDFMQRNTTGQRDAGSAGRSFPIGSAEEMIRANEEAQAMEVDALKETVKVYQGQIEELQRQAARNAELVEQMRVLNEETVRNLQEVVDSYVTTLTDCSNALHGVNFGAMQQEIQGKVESSGSGIQSSLQETEKEIKSTLAQLRLQNAQSQSAIEAAIVNLGTQNGESLEKTLEDIKAALSQLQEQNGVSLEKTLGDIKEALKQLQEQNESARQQSDDYAHRENVRVYRNVQAATEKLIQTQTGELNAHFDELKKPQTPKISWIQILTLLLAGGCVVLEVLQILGIL